MADISTRMGLGQSMSRTGERFTQNVHVVTLQRWEKFDSHDIAIIWPYESCWRMNQYRTLSYSSIYMLQMAADLIFTILSGQSLQLHFGIKINLVSLIRKSLTKI
jgi:hypothetical protein